jgi:DNA-binding response OmpR family regulator
MERRLLAVLSARLNQWQPLHAIFTEVYRGTNSTADARILDVMIHKMRKKMVGTAYTIETDRMLGRRLVFTAPVQKSDDAEP